MRKLARLWRSGLLVVLSCGCSPSANAERVECPADAPGAIDAYIQGSENGSYLCTATVTVMSAAAPGSSSVTLVRDGESDGGTYGDCSYINFNPGTYLPSGSYDVTAVAPGYRSSTILVNVPTDDPACEKPILQRVTIQLTAL